MTSTLWGALFASNFDARLKDWVHGPLSDIMAQVEKRGLKVRLVTAVERESRVGMQWSTIEFRAYPPLGFRRKFESIVYCAECRRELSRCDSLNAMVLEVMEEE